MKTGGIIVLTVFSLGYCCVFFAVCTCISWYFRQRKDNFATFGNQTTIKAKTKEGSINFGTDAL